MERELEKVRQQYGEKLLMLTGVRVGESAARDQRIAMSCTKDGGECGQGWFQQTSSSAVADTLAPLLHWRICNVWDWLRFEAPELGFPTEAIADVYGMSNQSEDQEPLALRTGCIGCPLVQEDRALESVVSDPDWAYLLPLTRLRPLYREIKKPQYRLRKVGERRKDGKLATNQGRLGPLTMDARRWMLAQVLEVQEEINTQAIALGKPPISLINDEELARIYELIEANTWPQKWDGTEINGSVLVEKTYSDGSIQPLLGEVG